MDCLREGENHAEGVCACVYRGECMRVYERLRLYCVSKKRHVERKCK
jgi:hypothetical protein